MFRANWQIHSPNNNVHSDSQRVEQRNGTPSPETPSLNGNRLPWDNSTLRKAFRLTSQRTATGDESWPGSAKETTHCIPFIVQRWNKQPWCRVLKVIMAITFIEKYKYTIGFTYLPLKHRKEGNVSLGQPRIHVTVKAAYLFFTLCLLPNLGILKKLKQKILYHFFLPTSFPQFCFNHLVLKH